MLWGSGQVYLAPKHDEFMNQPSFIQPSLSPSVPELSLLLLQGSESSSMGLFASVTEFGGLNSEPNRILVEYSDWHLSSLQKGDFLPSLP